MSRRIVASPLEHSAVAQAQNYPARVLLQHQGIRARLAFLFSLQFHSRVGNDFYYLAREASQFFITQGVRCEVVRRDAAFQYYRGNTEWSAVLGGNDGGEIRTQVDRRGARLVDRHFFNIFCAKADLALELEQDIDSRVKPDGARIRFVADVHHCPVFAESIAQFCRIMRPQSQSFIDVLLPVENLLWTQEPLGREKCGGNSSFSGVP